MPYGLRNSFSSSILASTRRSLASSRMETRRRPATPGLLGSWMAGAQFGAGVQEPAGTARRFPGISPSSLRLKNRRRAQGQQADHRPNLEPLGPAVGQAQHVVEEAVFLVPHAGLAAQVRHRRGNPQEMLGELEGHVHVVRVGHRQLRGDFQHVLAEQRHPGGAVGLLQVAAGRQRGAAVEDADVVQTEEAALEDVPPRAVLAVDPPGEVQEQFLETALEPFGVPLRPSRPFPGGR